MSTPIEDYAIIGDTRTVAAVARDGSIDWWCVPRIDSGAVFAALLGEPEHGRWSIAPKGTVTTTHPRSTRAIRSCSRPSTRPRDGTVKVIDFMSPGVEHPTIFRHRRRRVGFGDDAPRADRPLRLRVDRALGAGDRRRPHAGRGQRRACDSTARCRSRASDLTTTADFTVAEGQRRGFSLAWYSTLEDPPLPLDARAALRATQQYWAEWMERCTYQGEWRDDVVRSLITVKALQYAPTGAVCAAATTSLPEQLGGVRNWDYRFSWLRDSSLTLQALVLSGFATKRPRGSTGCNARSPAIRATSRSCTASAVSAG